MLLSRKNKPAAVVEFLDDEPEDLSSARNELFAGRTTERAGQAHGGLHDSALRDDDLCSDQQLNALLEHEAQRGSAMVTEIRDTVGETRTVATATGDKLVAQSEQLRAIKADVDESRWNTEKARPVVEKLTTGFFTRTLRKPYTRAQRHVERRQIEKLEEESAAIKDAAQAREKGGVRALRSKAKSDFGSDEIADSAFLDANDSNTSRSSNFGRTRAAKTSAVRTSIPSSTVTSSNSYEHISNETVRTALREQDDVLDDISTGVAELHDYANAFGAELQYQALIIDAVNTEDVTNRIQEAQRKLRRAK